MLGQGWSFHIRAMNLLGLRAGVKLANNRITGRGKRSAEFQSRFVIDFDDFANKTGISLSFWTLLLWPDYM